MIKNSQLQILQQKSRPVFSSYLRYKFLSLALFCCRGLKKINFLKLRNHKPLSSSSWGKKKKRMKISIYPVAFSTLSTAPES